MNTFKMMIGRLCLLLILRTHEQRAFIIFCFFVFFFLRILYAFMKERAETFFMKSLHSHLRFVLRSFSRDYKEKTSTKRERRESYVIKVYSSSSLKREQKRDNAQ